MASYKCFYDSTEEKGLLGAFALKDKYGSSISFTDCQGKNEAQMLATISGLTDDTYTSFFVLVDVDTSHAEADFTYDQIAAMRDKLITASKGTTVTSGTAQANSTKTEIILAAGSSAVNDTYNGNYIATAGTTAVNRYITDYVGSTVTATVTDTGTAITTTETYVVYTLTNVFLYGATDSDGKSTAQLVWEKIHPDTQLPLVFHYMSKYKNFMDYGTAQAADATTITLAATAGDGATKTRANDVYNDAYVYIYSATTNKGTWAKIDDFVSSTAVATLDSDGWNDGTPATSIIYRIVPRESELFLDAYTELFVKTHFNDITDSDQINDFKKLIDKNDRVNDAAPPKDLDQDLDLLTEYLDKGKSIFKYSLL